MSILSHSYPPTGFFSPLAFLQSSSLPWSFLPILFSLGQKSSFGLAGSVALGIFWNFWEEIGTIAVPEGTRGYLEQLGNCFGGSWTIRELFSGYKYGYRKGSDRGGCERLWLWRELIGCARQIIRGVRRNNLLGGGEEAFGTGGWLSIDILRHNIL